jgi:RNase P/RNase MRP subunit p30
MHSKRLSDHTRSPTLDRKAGIGSRFQKVINQLKKQNKKKRFNHVILAEPSASRVGQETLERGTVPIVEVPGVS